MNISKIYNRDFPKNNELVNIKITNIGDNCLFGELLDYENKECLISFKYLKVNRGRKAILKIKKKYKVATKHFFLVRNDNDHLEYGNNWIDDESLNQEIKSYKQKKKILQIFNHFIIHLFNDHRIYESNKNLYLSYLEKTFWKINENDWYTFVLDIKLNLNTLDIFDLNNEEKKIFIEAINKVFIDVVYSLNINFELIVFDIEAIQVIKNIISKFDDIIVKHHKSIIDIQEIPDYHIHLNNTPNYEIKINHKQKKLILNIFDDLKNINPKNIIKNCNFKIKSSTITNNLNLFTENLI